MKKPIQNTLRTISTVPIVVYRICISPFLGHHCRYTPTCSEYTRQAIIKYGFFKGVGMGVLRISRCHPWARRSPVDPV